jgi:hypothetical protein
VEERDGVAGGDQAGAQDASSIVTRSSSRPVARRDGTSLPKLLVFVAAMYPSKYDGSDSPAVTTPAFR